MPSYLDFDPEPELNTADPPVGAPEGGYKGKHVNDTFRYIMAVIRLLGDAVPKLKSGMAADSEIGDLALKSLVSASDINTGAVTEDKIGSAAVTNAKLGSGAVSSIKIFDGAVGTGKIADGAVTEAKLASSAVTEVKLASNAVTGPKIAFGTITSAKIAAGAVVEAGLGTGAVTNSKLGAASVSPDKLSSAALLGVAKGWVKFNEDAQQFAAHNIASVTGSSGDYTITWTVPFTSAHYVVVATVLHDGSSNAPRMAHIFTQTASTVRIQIRAAAGSIAVTGVEGLCVVAFGSQ